MDADALSGVRHPSRRQPDARPSSATPDFCGHPVANRPPANAVWTHAVWTTTPPDATGCTTLPGVTDVDLLESVLGKTETLVAGVRPDQRARATPCPDYDVEAMVNHLVAWARSFAATATGEERTEDPATFVAGDRPATQFREAADRMVAAFRGGALDRTLTVAQAELPGSAVLGMVLMEFVGHGWDLATATDQAVPFSDEEADAALAAGRTMLAPEFRGPGKAFGYEVPVPDGAGSVEKLIGFLGRRPARQG
jgi:uncharacterized protein (TIGR03086 family)